MKKVGVEQLLRRKIANVFQCWWNLCLLRGELFVWFRTMRWCTRSRWSAAICSLIISMLMVDDDEADGVGDDDDDDGNGCCCCWGIVTFVLDVTVFRNGSLGSWGFKFAAKCQRWTEIGRFVFLFVFMEILILSWFVFVQLIFYKFYDKLQVKWKIEW